MPDDTQQRVETDERKNSRARGYIELVANAGLAALILWKGIWTVWRVLGSDFPQYYLGARLLTEHYKLDRIYDWIWFQRIADRYGFSHQLVGYSGLTPFCAFPLLPLAWLPLLQAKHLWVLLNVVLLIALAWMLSRTTGLPLRKTGLIALLAVIPLRSNFALGQMHIVVLALLIAGWRFHLRGKQVASGCCIALAGALKIYPLFYCFYFLIKRRWRALSAVIATTAVCLMLCWLVFGGPATSTFLLRQLPRLLNGEAVDPFNISRTSASAMFHRVFLFDPELNPHPLLSSPLLFAASYSLWQALLTGLVLSRMRANFRPDQRETLEWCAFLTLLMFLSSAPSTYHFVVLIGTAVPTYRILEIDRPRLSWLFLAVYVVACNGQNLVRHGSLPTVFTALLIPKLWAGVGLLIIYVAVLSSRGLKDEDWAKEVSSRSSNRKGEHSRWFGNHAVFGPLVAALWLVGVATTWAHVRFLGMDNSRRIMEKDQAWMRTEPQATAQGLYYVAMLDTGYMILRDGAPIRDVPVGDELSYATDRDGQHLWIETESSTGSAITEVGAVDNDPVRCVIDDAESPALTQDGDSLAFIREERGHGSLWVADPHACGSPGPPVRVTPTNIDVRSVSGAPEGRFVFSALTDQGPAVFVVSHSRRPEVLLRPGSVVDSVAASGDGETLILSERILGRLQLVSESLGTYAARQLTSGDCNATTPWWKDTNTVIYATDCGRGMGFTTLVQIDPLQ